MGLLLLLAGCTTFPTPEERTKAYYGPFPEEYEQIIIDALPAYLPTVGSAVLAFQDEPIKRFLTKPFDPDTIYGWGGLIKINGQEYLYIIRDGQIQYLDNFFTLAP